MVLIIVVRSGHEDFQSLFATNDQVTPSFIVNQLGAPNQSTVVVRGIQMYTLFIKLVNNFSVVVRTQAVLSATWWRALRTETQIVIYQAGCEDGIQRYKTLG